MTSIQRRMRQYVQRSVCGLAAVLLVVGVSGPTMPLAYAVDAPSCNPVAPAPSGIQQPTGADAGTYTYNACTGLWENPHYTWSPATQQATPKDVQVYTCNPTTQKWDSEQWVYSPASRKWVQVPFSVDQPPSGPNVQHVACPAPTPVLSASPTTGTGSGATTTTNTAATTNIGTTNTAAVTNNIGSVATSGNAAVLASTNAGSATSGNAEAVANVINMLQSSSSLGATAATFTVDINGDVQGDLILDPGALQPALDSSVNTTNNLDINVDNNGNITNNVTLSAQTGNATVADNTNGGNATSGNAQAVANVVNMVNSMISANQSFVGVVNINGNFNGNILMPQKFLDSLVASNAPHSDIQISQDTLNKIALNLSNNTSIANNVQSSATSGNATVADNTNAGSATSGSAKTNVTIFNLTGLQLTGGNTMLVFVNVLGKWVGVLMNAPAGSTAAAFGGGIRSVTNTNTASLAIANGGAVTNNIDVNTKSGDATVADNTNGGNATSGNAKTAVNLNNIVGSNLNLTGWFGILFINVFGNWNGNFGVATVLNSPAVSGSGGVPSAVPQVFGFKPTVTQPISSETSAAPAASSQDMSAQLTSVARRVLGDTVLAGPPNVAHQQVVQSKDQTIVAGLVLFGLGAVLLVIEQVHARGRHRQ